METQRQSRTVREEVKLLADRLPNEATWDDVMYQLYVHRKLNAAELAADEGRVLDHDDVKRRLLSK